MISKIAFVLFLASVGLCADKSEAHFTRAKMLMLQALREFDAGVKANPQAGSINSDTWRRTVVNSAQELDRLISPKARESRSGARFEAMPQLLSESKR